MNKITNINLRITSDEKELIKKKAKEANMKLSEYIRSSTLNGTKYQIITTTEIKEIND